MRRMACAIVSAAAEGRVRWIQRAVLALATVLPAAVVPAMASAQNGAAPPPAASNAAPQAAAPAASDSAPPKPVIPATGYGWSTKPEAPARGHARARAAPVDANPTGKVIPGFETLADGSSRVFVQMPKPATYSAKLAKSSVTYVLKDVHIDRRNNLNALVTTHFNTPVTSARLVPHGGDVWLVVDLRANVQPSAAMDATKDGGAILRIEFPKGDYLSGLPAAASSEPGSTPGSTGGDAPAASSGATSSPATSAPVGPTSTVPPAPAPSASVYAPTGL